MCFRVAFLQFYHNSFLPFILAYLTQACIVYTPMDTIKAVILVACNMAYFYLLCEEQFLQNQVNELSACFAS